MTTSDGNAVLVNVLSSSLRSALNGMETAPALIRRVLEEGAWRSFITPRGEHVEHTTFASFVATAPTAGLGQDLRDVVRLLENDHETLKLLAAALGTPMSDLLDISSTAHSLGSIERDAHAFGAHMRAGGWLLGLMVARSVQPGKQRSRVPRQPKQQTGAAGPTKVSAAEFALKAGCSVDRVMRYYRAWERSAAAGHVPHFDQLTPGIDVPLPEPDLWSEFFVSYERSNERRESLAQQADDAGTSYTQALAVATHPGALRTAILGDEKTAEVAYRAVFDRLEDDSSFHSLVVRNIASAPELRKAISQEAKRSEQTEYVERVLEDGVARTPTGEVIKLSESTRRTIADQLRELGGMQDVEATKTALTLVQEAIAEEIENDDAIRVHEQRMRVHKVLNSTVRGIEAISIAEVYEVVDDEIRGNIVALQKAINDLADAIAGSSRKHLRAV